MPFNMHAWIYLSRHVAHLISLPFCSDHEWMSWTLVSRLMQSALCNGDPSWATERMGGRKTWDSVLIISLWEIMWLWDTDGEYWLELLLVAHFVYCLFWQSGGWTLGLIRHRGRSSQVPESCISSCCSSHTAASIKFCFSFLMILVLIKPLT
jgi:hypothetical protein